MARTCGYCQSPIGAEEADTVCPACSAPYHQDCWHENDGCAVYGCAQTPEAQPRQAVEIPVSYWGQEHKPCPACGRAVLAAALRCRHCGTVFGSARPEDASRFQARMLEQQRLPTVKRGVVFWFALSLIPCLAPIALVGGAVQYRRRRSDVAQLPSIFRALAKLGIIISAVQTIGLATVLVIYRLLIGH